MREALVSLAILTGSEEIDRRFRAAGIEIAFPVRMVIHPGGSSPDRPLQEA